MTQPLRSGVGNALRLDWLSICPPTGTGVKFQADDLFSSPLDQVQIHFENEGGETYICGNPPYLGSKWQSDEQKGDLRAWRSLASNNAGVTVAIVGISSTPPSIKRLFSLSEDGSVQERQFDHIDAYRVPGRVNSVEPARRPISSVSPMLFGNMPRDGGAFLLDAGERARVLMQYPELERFEPPGPHATRQ